jgi:choloylglycine hydrolase
MKSQAISSLSFFAAVLLMLNSAQGQPPLTGIDVESTINSFEAVGEFYRMDYSGDYNELLDWIDEMNTLSGGSPIEGIECSLFSANGDLDNQLFGRNFDNPQNDVLITRYDPPDGYSSLAFTRLSDLGFNYGTNFSALTYQQKMPLVFAPYYVPDGINEQGLAAGLAAVDPLTYTIDPSKDTIFVTRLIREILDHAQNIDEAISIANSYNVFDTDITTISHHVLVGSVSGESVTLEFADGEFQAIFSDSDWQVLTNIPVYNIPHEQLMNSCWRYNSLYTTLENSSGILSWPEGMDALETVHINCPWSAIYDLNNEGIYIAVHNNYEDIAFTDLDSFEFVVYVGIDSPAEQKDLPMLRQNYPNPFRYKTTIGFCIRNSGDAELIIYDRMGRQVRAFLDGSINAGNYQVTWDSMSDSGEPAAPGVYYCMLNSGGRKDIIKMILMGQ